jgi:hypothetical protein
MAAQPDGAVLAHLIEKLRENPPVNWWLEADRQESDRLR